MPSSPAPSDRTVAPSLQHRDDLAVGLRALVVAGELAAHRRQIGERDDVALRRRVASRALALLVHQAIERDRIDGGSAFRRDLARELERKTVRIVQQKGLVAADDAFAVARAPRRSRDRASPCRARAYDRRSAPPVAAPATMRGCALAQLRIARLERTHDGRHELGEKSVGIAEQPAVANRAADQEAQHEAAIGVRRIDAVVDQERRRAQVVGDDVLPSRAAPAAESDVRPIGGCAATRSVKRSVSYIEATPLQTASIRSRPAPVSIALRGSSASLPSAPRLYC